MIHAGLRNFLDGNCAENRFHDSFIAGFVAVGMAGGGCDGYRTVFCGSAG
jgi:hypothetical protein